MSSFEEILAKDGKLVYKTRGVSMEPMLRQNRDLVVITATHSRLKKYDVAFYKRGKDYVLHRVIEIKENYYLIRGDNTFVLERVPDNAILGVLSSFQRKSKFHEVNEKAYKCYVRLWIIIYPIRYFYYILINKLKTIARKLGITPILKKLILPYSLNKKY